jgi:hypothetical protein
MLDGVVLDLSKGSSDDDDTIPLRLKASPKRGRSFGNNTVATYSYPPRRFGQDHGVSGMEKYIFAECRYGEMK